MPRWAESLVIVGVAVVVAFAILVIARLRTHDSVEAFSTPDPALARSRAIASLPADLLDVSVAPPPRQEANLEAALAAAPFEPVADPPAVGLPERVTPPPTAAAADGNANTGGNNFGGNNFGGNNFGGNTPGGDDSSANDAMVASADAAPMADVDSDADALADASDATDDLTDSDASDADGADAAADTTAGRDALAAAAQAEVQPGSREELLLLRDAEQALAHLHAVRLRGDVPKQVTLDEAKRLEAILSRLPEGRRKELNALLDVGYRRIDTIELGPDGVPVVRDARLGGTDTDDRPADLKGVSDRVRALEQKLGVAPTAPAPTRPAATNPTTLPSVESSPTAPAASAPAPSAPSTAPSTAPSALPSATSTPL